MISQARSRILLVAAQEDRRWVERVRLFLTPLERIVAVEIWDDSQIDAGSRTDDAWNDAVSGAHTIILLVSASLLALGITTLPALQRVLRAAERGELNLLQVVVGHCLVTEDPDLSRIASYNPPHRPLDSMKRPQQDEVLSSIARNVLGSLRQPLPGSSTTPREQVTKAASAASDPEDTLPMQPPGAPYNAVWHISRPRAEREARSYLSGSGAPVVLWGAAQSGKTWLMDHMICEQRQRDVRIVRLSLHAFEEAHLESLDRLFRELAVRIDITLAANTQISDGAWRQKGTSSLRFASFLERTLAVQGRVLLLAIDRADAILDRPYRNDFFSIIRSYVEESAEPWSRLRLILTVSTVPSALTTSASSSVFLGLCEPIKLGAFDIDQSLQLARLHRLEWSSVEMATLVDVVGGHPYLMRAVMYASVTNRLDLHELLPPSDGAGIFARHLRFCRRLLAKDRLLEEEFLRIARGDGHINENAASRLQRAGLVAYSEGIGYRLRCALYEQLVTSILRS